MSDFLYNFLHSPVRYVTAFAAMLLFEWMFLLFARKMNIGAPVSERSSHRHFTPTAGGVIIPLSFVAFAIYHSDILTAPWWWMLAGALILGVMSFIDDIRPLPPLPRLITQVIVLALAFQNLCHPASFDIFLLVIISCVCCINAFNFIDGIAGMLCLYGIVVVGTMLYAVNHYQPELVGLLSGQCIVVLLALTAFACFNLGDKIFAGDVGAICLGYFVAYIMATLVLDSSDASIIVLITVGPFDACMTTLQRLFAGKNILLPHRECIYQVLTSRWGLPHITVSLAYALLQMLINALYFLIPEQQHWTYFIIVIALLSIVYFSIRRSPQSHMLNS